MSKRMAATQFAVGDTVLGTTTVKTLAASSRQDAAFGKLAATSGVMSSVNQGNSASGDSGRQELKGKLVLENGDAYIEGVATKVVDNDTQYKATTKRRRRKS